MKRLIGLLIVISSLTATAQRPVPDSILTKIIEDLIRYDHAKYALNVKDSIITVYKHKDSVNQVKIEQYKLNAAQYEQVVTNLKQISEIDEKTINRLERQLKMVRIREKIIIVIGIAAIILI
jgi:hypothetical protein